MSSETVEGILRPNNTFVPTLMAAMREDGCGIFERIIVRLRLRRLSDQEMLEVERSVTHMLVNAPLGVGQAAVLEKGVLVGNWQDFFEWFLDNLPSILEAIMMIIAIF